jgi:O-antigen/teichoic acid export membrane protein
VKYAKNTSWLFAEKIFRISISLLITIWMARYLGPEQFGTFNYALSFAALFGVLSSLGLDKLVTKELLTHPHESNHTVGTSFVLRLIGAVLLIPLAAFGVMMVRPDNELLLIMILILASVMILISFEIIKNWFESYVQAK